MTEWYNVAPYCNNIWTFLTVIVISVTVIVCRILSAKRDKQFIESATETAAQEHPSLLHISITEGKTRYEFDRK